MLIGESTMIEDKFLLFMDHSRLNIRIKTLLRSKVNTISVPELAYASAVLYAQMAFSSTQAP